MENVGDYMRTERPHSIFSDCLEKVSKQIVDFNCPEITIVNNEVELKPVGVITEHDILRGCLVKGKRLEEARIDGCLSGTPVVVEAELPIDQCSNVLKCHHLKTAPVIDGSGKYCGDIILEDLISLIDEEFS